MMFVHICRVCSGGNIPVASNALMFCILMSRAEIRPLSSKLWGIGPALLVYRLLWKYDVSVLGGETVQCSAFSLFSSLALKILFKWGRGRREAPPDTASDISEGGNESDYSHREDDAGDDDGDNGHATSFVFLDLWEISCSTFLPLRLQIHTISFPPVASCQLCSPLSTSSLASLSLRFPVFQLAYYILHRCFRIGSFFFFFNHCSGKFQRNLFFFSPVSTRMTMHLTKCRRLLQIREINV